MARLRLIVAGLPETAAWADLSPALAETLRRGRVAPAPPPTTPSQALARLFFPAGAPAALAPIRLGHESAPPGDAAGAWLCADPVHLRLMRDHVLLGDARVLAIDIEEARALCAGLNAHFAGRAHFHAAAPERWYARLDAAAFAEARARPAPPLDAVLARPVEAGFARGGLAALHNEIQMYLHAHPVNQTREADGAEAINGLWLWGAGDASARPEAPGGAFAGDYFLAEALARAAGIPCLNLADAEARLRAGDDLTLCLGALHAPARYGQTEAWRAAFAEYDARVFQPLRAALRGARYAETHIDLLGEPGRALRLGRWDAWRFWRR
jgi:hypothetical protein